MIILSKNYVFSHSSPFPFSHHVIKSDKKRIRECALLILIYYTVYYTEIFHILYCIIRDNGC